MLNQWLKRILPIAYFSHLVSCHFYLLPLDTDNVIKQDVVIMVQSTLGFLTKASNGFSLYFIWKFIEVNSFHPKMYNGNR